MSSSLILCNSNRPFLDCIVICNKKQILYDNQWPPTQWLDQEEAPKHFPKPRLYQKQSRALFYGLLLVWSTIAFWIPVSSLHLRSIFSKWMSFTKDCKVWSQHWSTERAQFFSMIIPNCTLQTNVSKLNKLGYKVRLICHIYLTSCPLTTTSSSISTTFSGKMLTHFPHRNYFPRVHWILKHGFFCCRNKQTYFLLAKMCWL